MLKRVFGAVNCILLCLCLLFSFAEAAQERAANGIAAQTLVRVVFPYSLDKKVIDTVYAGSTVPLYLGIETMNYKEARNAEITVNLPLGLKAGKADSIWRVTADRRQLRSSWALKARYSQDFKLVPIEIADDLSVGDYSAEVIVKTPEKEFREQLPFKVKAAVRAAGAENKQEKKTVLNWYIQAITLPVDKDGVRDAKLSEGSIVIRDTEFENFRNRMIGEGAVNWASVFNHPATHLLLELRNPKNDVKVLKFKAELLDKNTGRVVPGLAAAGALDALGGSGFGAEGETRDATTALLSLDGMKNQTFIVPLYVDTEHIVAGDYDLRVSVASNNELKVSQMPFTVLKKSSLNLFAVGFSFVCLFILLLSLNKLRRTIKAIGAKGAITVALFAAVAFGGIVVPTTLGGDLLRVFLGPFTSLVTGLLNGTLLYLLMIALIMLYRRPGIVALLFLVKWLMAGIMFGRFTPLSLLLYAVYIVTIEGALYVIGFYTQKEINKKYMLFAALILGIADALVTLINIEQMMFFYRLYYADWYIALYMLVNGLLYSSIGAFMGYKAGRKLQQVMGE